MKPIFDFPSVDHLVEGVHYTLVDYDFAERQAFAIGYPQQQYEEGRRDRGLQTNMPSKGGPSTFAEECGPGEKMVFGMCRSAKANPRDDKDFDSSKKTKQESDAESEAKKQKSEFKNNKMVKDVKSGKKLGWAMKDGKPVLVEWGSVAGEKKVGPKQPPKAPKGASRSGVTDSTRAGQRTANANASAQQVNQAGREAQDRNRDLIESRPRSAG